MREIPKNHMKSILNHMKSIYFTDFPAPKNHSAAPSCSSIPKAAHSRPRPDAFTPPKGSDGSLRTKSFTKHIPASKKNGSHGVRGDYGGLGRKDHEKKRLMEDDVSLHTWLPNKKYAKNVLQVVGVAVFTEKNMRISATKSLKKGDVSDIFVIFRWFGEN